MRLYSLRRATFSALLVPTVLAIVLISVSALFAAQQAISILRDHEMQQEAAFLMTLSLHEAAEGEKLDVIKTYESFGLQQLHASGTGFRIWSGDLIVTAAGALPDKPVPPLTGFDDVSAKGERWRRYVLRHGQLPITVELAEPAEVRDELTWRMAASLIGPMLLLIVAVGIIAWWQITVAMRPMMRISAEIDARDSEDLGPLGDARIPREIAPLVVAVNQLMTRLGSTLEREREFTDNAAHELRTPLAALKARAQLAERALEGMPAQQEELALLVAAIDRATRVIEQVILLSRLQGGHARKDYLDFSSLVEDVARDLAPFAIARSQQLDADIRPGMRVWGNADTLAMVVRNLIDNAIRHTPPCGHVSIGLVEATDGAALFTVSDDGPGIPPDKHDLAFERFARFSHDEPGSGLGLAIVDRIVALHDGAISLGQRHPQGLLCEVRLPRTAKNGEICRDRVRDAGMNQPKLS